MESIAATVVTDVVFSMIETFAVAPPPSDMMTGTASASPNVRPARPSAPVPIAPSRSPRRSEVDGVERVTPAT